MIQLNNLEVNIKKFPNGESLIKTDELKIIPNSINKIYFKFETNSDLIDLMFIQKLLKANNIESHLTIAYMPYSRMDRTDGSTIFTLKYIADFINWLDFKAVIVVDSHSDVTNALLNKNISASVSAKLLYIAKHTIEFNKEKDFIFLPDSGAEKRYSKILKGYNVLVGSKDRDFETGSIKKLTIHNNTNKNIKGRDVIILDDLCSRGGTFMLSGKELKDLGANSVSLVVTHCEETIKDGDLLKDNSPIDFIVTSNSIINNTDVRISNNPTIPIVMVYNLQMLLSL